MAERIPNLSPEMYDVVSEECERRGVDVGVVLKRAGALMDYLESKPVAPEDILAEDNNTSADTELDKA